MILKQPETKESFANVASPCANAGGQKRDWQLELLDNHSAFGRSCVALGMFKTKTEAGNFMKFCQSDIVRFLFLMSDEALTTFAKEFPYFIDWETADGQLDFSRDINMQLCTLFKLTKSESSYVTKTIRTIDASRGKSTRSSTRNTASSSPSRSSSNP